MARVGRSARHMSAHTAAWVLALTVISVGCDGSDAGPASSTRDHQSRVVVTEAERPPVEAFDLRHSDDFLFRVDDYDWEWQGSTIYRIDASGLFTYVRPVSGEDDGVEWRESTRQLSPSDIAALRGLLERERFPSLAADYELRGLADGLMTTLWLRSNGHLVRVHCHNHYPPAVRRVFGRMRDLVPKEDAPYRVIDQAELRDRWVDPEPLLTRP